MAGGGAVSGSPALGPGGISAFDGGAAGSSDGMVVDFETRAGATAIAAATTAAGAGGGVASVQLDVDVPRTVEHNGEVRRAFDEGTKKRQRPVLEACNAREDGSKQQQQLQEETC